MEAFYSDTFALPLPPGHKFPMGKYTRLRERLVAEGVLGEDRMHVPEGVRDDELHRAHDPDYVFRVVAGRLDASEVRRIGFPWSERLVERSRRSAGATIAACRSAIDSGLGINLAGGTHHAFRDRGEGFCVFNDAAVAARAMQDEGRALRVVVLDCDVHQGNGTAAIFRDDDTVFTFSIHGAGNYPYRKEAGDLDIALPDGTSDDAYLDALNDGLRASIGRARADLAIYLSGADPHEGDRFGRLRLSKAGLCERDRRVFDACSRAGIPVALVMAGGYGRNVEDTVDIHVTTVREAIGRLL